MHGHSDYAEDFFAIVQLLEEYDKMPETLILSLRYRIFEPVKLRKHNGWREWVPEYRKMSKKLGIEPHSYLETLQTNHWLSLLSLKDLMGRIGILLSVSEKPTMTKESRLDNLDIIMSDGSLTWSTKNQTRFSPEYAAIDAKNRLDRFVDFDLKIDEKLLGNVDVLFAYLSKLDTKIILAQTPFHPIFFDGIQETKFGKTLAEIEKIGNDMFDRYGFQKIGSFNPHELGCSSDQFIDWHHGTPECLERVLTQANFRE